MINSKFSVYLAGPIAGLTFDGAADWREKAIERLTEFGIKGLSPLRAKEYLRGSGELSSSGDAYAHINVLSSSR
jgi:hypothetical protein